MIVVTGGSGYRLVQSTFRSFPVQSITSLTLVCCRMLATFNLCRFVLILRPFVKASGYSAVRGSITSASNGPSTHSSAFCPLTLLVSNWMEVEGHFVSGLAADGVVGFTDKHQHKGAFECARTNQSVVRFELRAAELPPAFEFCVVERSPSSGDFEHRCLSRGFGVAYVVGGFLLCGFVS